MNWHNPRRPRRSNVASPASSRARRTGPPLAFEPLEGRLLLSLYQGPTRSRPVFSNGAYYKVTLTGPGYETVTQTGTGHHQQFAINLTGTTNDSMLSVALMLARPGFGSAHSHFEISRINVASGELGGIQALGTADLVGSISPLNGSVSTLQFDSIGPNSQIDVKGGLGGLNVSGGVTLGPTGRIHVASLTGPVSLGGLTLDGGQFVVDGGISGPFHSGGLTIDRGGRLAVGGDLSGAFSAGALTLDGGQFLVGHDVSGPFSAGGISLQNGSLFSVGQDFLGTSTGGLNDTGNLTVGANSAIVIGHNLGELGVTQPYSLNVGQALSLNGGKLIVGNDVNAPIQVGSGLSVSNGGQLAVGRDLLPPGLAPVSSGVAPLAGLSVGGDLTLDSGGGLNVGRDLNGLNVNGDLRFTPSAGSIAVGGNLTNLTINGVFQGKGTAGIDLSVGLDLNGFTVHGGSPNLGGVHGANIDVGKSILGLDVRHGIFNSLITAGVSIGAGVIGPDGNDAVFDSQLLAGSSINLAFNGNIRSDWVTNPNHAGYRTRLVAGVTRQGVYSSGGALNAQISGALIDSVLAASVAPFGGNGMLPPTGYGIPVPAVSSKPGDKGNNTYDAPGGVTSAGNPTYTAPPYNAMLDPTIDDAVLPSGTITASVGGGVISTPHGANPDANDFAGFFAADTTNVGLGAPPKKS